MIYQKPSNMSYTDLAIFIDNNIYSEKCDEEKCYKYLYILFNMLAAKNKFFKHQYEYDDFCVYAASTLFLRYKNKRQFLEGEEAIPKIKSSLNYIKNIIFPLKINYQKENFCEVFEDVPLVETAFNNDILDASEEENSFVKEDFTSYINNICDNRLKKLNLNKNEYISVVLTLLNIFNITPNKNNADSYIKNKYKHNKSKSVVLYHLPPSCKDKIETIIYSVEQGIIKDLNYIIGT